MVYTPSSDTFNNPSAITADPKVKVPFGGLPPVNRLCKLKASSLEQTVVFAIVPAFATTVALTVAESVADSSQPPLPTVYVVQKTPIPVPLLKLAAIVAHSGEQV